MTQSSIKSASKTKSAWDVLEPRNLELGPVILGAASPWQNWTLQRDDDGIAWLVIDRKDAGANTLNEAVISELDAVLAALEQQRPRGLVIRSAKPTGFIAGADIAQFRGIADASKVAADLSRAHAVVDRLANLPLPTVAVIHGFCLGGGLEIALACTHRIAIDDARLGFPEVQLGVHPGLGGTVRSTHLINPLTAMTNMLTAKNVSARQAKSLGLVDAVTQERHVRAAVKVAVNGKLPSARQGLLGSVLNSGLVRPLLASRMRAETKKKARPENYPAPFALIDLWEKHGGDRAAMQKAEITSFAKLIVGRTAQNLVHVFYLREGLKKLAAGKWDGEHIHVIGAGAMGGDIAAWCAWSGFRVTLADMKPEPLAAAVKRAAELYKKIGRNSRDIRDALDRLVPDLTGEGAAHANMIIEAVPEVLALKQKVYARIEPKMKDDAVLATNTSSIPLEQLRSGLKRPGRLVGIHFFNPVSRMQLVEVVSHDQADADVLTDARAFVGRIDRLPAPVKSDPGFLVNRALTPYLLEAMLMLDEGARRESIDAAAERFGMPMGPIELADTVGLDICMHVAEMLKDNLKRPMPDVPQWLRDKVEKGELGRKTGKGLYEWKDGHAVKDGSAPPPPPDTTDRLILPMLDVCVTCLREGVVETEDIVDGAMIFATGFAPFRGGPMHYARMRGVADILDTMKRLTLKYGDRFQPDPDWDRLG